MISVQSTDEVGRFGDADVRLLSTIAANVGAAIQNARLYEEMRRRADEMAALVDVGREISATLVLDRVLQRIAERAEDAARRRHERGLPARARTPDDFGAIVALGDIAEEIMADHDPARARGSSATWRRAGAAEFVNDVDGRPADRHDPGHRRRAPRSG